ncbi:DUF2141 domain-containing protein [Azospirillum canadense]|uniref:DUF2141 domain-containing protein n=1 Tax=Azospirillum canadense TaxID=403962 RepID=UPI00222680EC|nr:DUF2141 domain-containing protein [Azospirillum canadense]MCW2236419.1 uncharacterized protein (DUF2141 family) [Azospirillum canadense]
MAISLPRPAGEGRGGGITAALFLTTLFLTTLFLTTLFLTTLLPTTPSLAADLAVTVTNVHSDHGRVMVAVCTQDTFLKPGCPYTASAPAQAGAVTVTVRGVRPGTYAVQAFQDENGNEEVDRNFFGLPEEGIGFSNDAPIRFGPPSYADAAITVAEGGSRTALRLRYFIESGNVQSKR